jgi:hypothetical protein
MAGLEFKKKVKKPTEERIKAEEAMEAKILENEGNEIQEAELKNAPTAISQTSEETITVTARIPKSLFEQFDNYIKTKARRIESKNYCMVEALKLYLEKNDI